MNNPLVRFVVFLSVLFGTLLALAPTVHAQVYNRFGPADGILVGDPSTYITTPATSSDVRALWTGTCDATTFLRGDGSCADVTTGAAGSDGQVQFNASGVFGADAGLTYDSGTDALTVAGSITVPALNTSGVLAITATDVTVNGDGVCLSDGTNCPAGGGDATLAGNQTFSGLNEFSNSTTFSHSGDTGGAAAVRISSSTPVLRWEDTNSGTDEKNWRGYAAGNQLIFDARNDANDAGEQWLVVTRTGATVGNVQVNSGLSIGGPPRGENSLSLNSSTGGTLYMYDSGGPADDRTWRLVGADNVLILDKCNDAVSTCSDNALQIEGTPSGTTLVALNGDTFTVNSVDMTPLSGTFAASFNGCTAAYNMTVSYQKIGNFVTLYFPGAGVCTSNTTQMQTLSATLPAEIRPASNRATGPLKAVNNGVVTSGCLWLQPNGLILVDVGATLACASGGWSSSGSKGFQGSASYPIN